MGILLNILVSAAVTLAGTWGLHQFAPQVFGNTTISTVTTADTVKDALITKVNNSLASLNSNKVEISDLAASTSLGQLTTTAALATVGTITTGIWRGTAVGAQWGGTGSTTLSTGQVLLGNGTGNIGVVSGYGNSGQFLTSGGAGVAPTWTTSAIDQTASYNWTGSYFGIKNLNASSTAAQPITLNTLTYNTPSVRAASSTVLSEDGSGNLSWNPEDWILLVSTTTQQAMRYATTTISSAVSTTSQDIRIVYDNPGVLSGATTYNLVFNNDVGANYGYSMSVVGGNLITSQYSAQASIQLTGDTGTTSPAYFDINIKNVTANIKRVRYTGTLSAGTSQAPATLSGSGVWNNTGTGITTIVIGLVGAQTVPAGAIIRIYASGR